MANYRLVTGCYGCPCLNENYEYSSAICGLLFERTHQDWEAHEVPFNPNPSDPPPDKCPLRLGQITLQLV